MRGLGDEVIALRQLQDCRRRLVEIQTIIERADTRAMAADGPVARTELSVLEMKRIYKLSKGEVVVYDDRKQRTRRIRQ